MVISRVCRTLVTSRFLLRNDPSRASLLYRAGELMSLPPPRPSAAPKGFQKQLQHFENTELVPAHLVLRNRCSSYMALFFVPKNTCKPPPPCSCTCGPLCLRLLHPLLPSFTLCLSKFRLSFKATPRVSVSVEPALAPQAEQISPF